MIKFILGLFKSKINLAAFGVFALEIAEMIKDFIANTDFSGMSTKDIIIMILSFAITIFRTYFNKGSKNVLAKAGKP